MLVPQLTGRKRWRGKGVENIFWNPNLTTWFKGELFDDSQEGPEEAIPSAPGNSFVIPLVCLNHKLQFLNYFGGTQIMMLRIYRGGCFSNQW